jgi:chromate transporter
MQTVQQDAPQPGAWRIFLIFAAIGLQSFGGGASTTLLMQREFIEKRHWLTAEEFAHLWGLCQFAPGINLLGFTILVGKRVGRTAGIICALAGLLIPSSLITCLLAAGFKQVEHLPTAQAIERGVVPATAGIMLLVGVNFAYPLLHQAIKESLLNLLLSVLLIALCSIAILFGVPVPIALVSIALLGIVCFTRPLIAHTPAVGSDTENKKKDHQQ